MTKAKRVGPAMMSVRNFVERKSGCSMLAAAEHVGPHGSTRFGYASVHRAIAAGIVYAIQGANGWTRLYPIAK